MERLRQALLDGAFLLDLPATDLRRVLAQALDFVVARKLLERKDRELIEQQLFEPERFAQAAIGQSIAIPHAYSPAFAGPAIVFIRLRHPVNMDAPDGVPVRFVFLLLGPPGAPEVHLDTLASIARLASDDEFRFEAAHAATQLDLVAALDRFARRNRPRAGSGRSSKDAGLTYSGTWGGGLLRDIRTRWACYASDFRDGLHPKALAAVLFLFFACLAPAVTFGGVMAEHTGNQIGVVEMLLATALGGMIYAVASGQPLILLGGTGPVLVFTAILYDLCLRLNLQPYFLETYAWVGLWTAVFLVLLAYFEASCLMRFVTRFTDETFGALMSIIFIYYAVAALGGIVAEVYGSPTKRHDEALVPMLLTGGTFFIALSLSRFRRSRYLLPKVREFLADFGPAIAMTAMTVLAATWFWDVETKTLAVKGTLAPSSDRAWLVNPFRAPQWVWLASAAPAALAALLLFIVQNVTGRLINSPENRLRKGAAFHLDLAVIGLLIAFCSLLGLPWLIAATVRSLNQLRALADVDEVVSRNGETRERILHVRETRVTALAIHLLIGASLLVLPLLKDVPMTVLYGLFLYMGVVSMTGNQLFERIWLLATDPGLYPSTHYVRRVPFWTLHGYTFLQLLCLIGLTWVAFSSVAIILPLLLALLVPLRMLLRNVVKHEYLQALDAAEQPDDEEEHWL